MGMKHYPPGVTGTEPQLAGRPERQGELECPECTETSLVEYTVLTQHIDRHEAYALLGFTCPKCGEDVELEIQELR